MKKSLFLVTIMTVFLSGCTVLSFYPFYTQDVLVKDNKLKGKWKTFDTSEKPVVWEIYFPDSITVESEETNWEERKIANRFTYMMKCYQENNSGDSALFKIHLFKIHNQLFLDFMPEEWEISNEILSFHMMAAHTVAKVALNDSLQVNWMEPDWFDNLIKENKVRIHHERNDRYTLLTAKPEELKKFISKYASDKSAWKDGVEYSFCRKDD